MKKYLPSIISILILSFFSNSLLAHGVSQSDQEILTNGNIFSYIWVGAKHMITGYDHILFLVGVIFYLSSFKDIVKFISVFTAGHCITLIGATSLGIAVNDHLIDAIIALSVLYKGIENLGGFDKWFNIKVPNLLTMVFAFGLIHGLGLSTRLQSFDMGAESILLKTASFNVGVEFGQIAALIPIVFLLKIISNKSYFEKIFNPTNVFLILAGIGLFIFQMYGYIFGHLV